MGSSTAVPKGGDESETAAGAATPSMTAPVLRPQAAFWTSPAVLLLERLGTDGVGLTWAAAVERLGRFGPNEPGRPPRWLGAVASLRRVVSPLVVILLIASAVLAALRELIDAAVIALLVGLSVGIDLLQAHHRSLRAAERLRRRVEVQATVKRDGSWHDISVRDIVPGDRVRLSAGDIVPADARLISANALLLDEASYTGESLPVERQLSDTVIAVDPAEASNAL